MNCLQCGKEILSKRPNKYCSTKCAQDSTRKRKPCICKHCGKEYMPKVIDRVTYCSRECAFEHKKAKPKIKTKAQHNLTCAICGKEFLGRSNTMYCSDECKKAKGRLDYYKNKDKYLKQARDKYQSNIIYKDIECKECGIIFQVNETNNRRKYCSERCLTKATKRKEKHKRRMKIASQYVEHVYYGKIYKRDGGYCQICKSKVKIDRKLKAPHPLSGTLDHIIPLAKGGLHESTNIQLAHFICNSKKSDKLQDSQFKLAF